MTENDYLLAWGLYALAALGCLAVGFRLTRWMWRWLREPLRVLMAVLLLTPTIIDPVKEKFAPAIAITALDLLFKVGNNVLRAAADLAMYGMIAFALYGVFVVVRWPLEKRARARREQAEAAAKRDAEEATPSEAFAADNRDRYRNPPEAPLGGNRSRVEPRL
ncbi:MFS transporter [Pseudomonas auratipiscis]|uniref:MFS transporter n=1 Tax=Pseudomonas auratipiscis TaxID=3115853 RepID=A0AB35WW08_9PSED|nr:MULTISPECIES: MFS transporter [unclassified Pseudomonas]MEE1867321.1 MFS transporter [Pseudomonas sp. 120P]MEE1958148.1 MFS transporter [Pseudomonas sp. 119P]